MVYPTITMAKQMLVLTQLLLQLQVLIPQETQQSQYQTVILQAQYQLNRHFAILLCVLTILEIRTIKVGRGVTSSMALTVVLQSLTTVDMTLPVSSQYVTVQMEALLNNILLYLSVMEITAVLRL